MNTFLTSNSRYNSNPQGFKAIVEEFVANKDYATAYALLATVPEQATASFEYAAKRQGQVLDELMNQKAEELLTDLKSAIASAGDRYNPMVAGYLKMIPAKSKQYTEAAHLYDNYTKHVQDVRLDSIKHEQKMELERLAIEKIKMKYEQEAAMKQAEKMVNSSYDEGDSSDGEKESSGGLMASFKEHPFLWGVGAGALLVGAGGMALYGSLPLLSKLALAFLI